MQQRNRRRLAFATVAMMQVVGALSFMPSQAHAGTPTNRSVALSDSTVSKTGVTYTVTFTPTSTASIGAIAVEFCSQDPLQGTTCSAPTGMSTTAATGSVSGQSGSWTIQNGTNGYPYMTRTAAAATATATTVTFGNITNPSTNGTFYARIMTFASSSPTPLNATNDTNAVDFGGAAISTNSAISVTAKVQESLTFCTYVTGTTCSGGTGTAVDLGILSTSQVSAAASKFGVATNASSGVSVSYFGSTLTSGSNTFATNATGSAIAKGTELYGINLASSNNTNTDIKNPAGTAYTGSAAPVAATGGTPIGLVSASPTNYSTNSTFAFTPSTAAPAVPDPATRNAQVVAYSANPIVETTYVVNYAAAVSNLTKPGIYTSTVQYVATGVF